jgi:hypothetical protein
VKELRPYAQMLAVVAVVFLPQAQMSCPPGPGPGPDPTPIPTAEPTPPPEQQCHVIGAVCDCWHQPPGENWQWLECEEDCRLGTPHASEVARAQVKVKPYGRGAQATPFGCFGKDYYCSEEMDWPAACTLQRSCGPVAPDGHPQRVACERIFLGTDCPVWKGECTDPITGASCPITFDILIGDDPHPMNKTCPAPTGNHRAEGRGKVWACAVDEDGKLVTCSTRPLKVDQ